MSFLNRKQPQPQPRQRTDKLGQAPVYSYYARRSQEQAITGRQVFREVIEREKAAKTARISVRGFGIAVITVFLVGCAGNMLWLSSAPKVLPMGSDSASFLHSVSTYQAAAAKLFAGSIRNHTKLTVDTSGISAQLRRQYPELGQVSVTLPLIGHQPVVYIEPAAAQLSLITRSGATYSVDENGRTLAEISKPNPALIPVIDQSGTPVTVGQPALASNTVTFIRTVRFEVTQKQVQVSRFTLPAGTSELDMYISGTPYFVKFNLAVNSPLEQAGTFLAVIHHLTGEGKQPTSYIDVRLPGRAYYK